MPVPVLNLCLMRGQSGADRHSKRTILAGNRIFNQYQVNGESWYQAGRQRLGVARQFDCELVAVVEHQLARGIHRAVARLSEGDVWRLRRPVQTPVDSPPRSCSSTRAPTSWFKVADVFMAPTGLFPFAPKPPSHLNLRKLSASSRRASSPRLGVIFIRLRAGPTAEPLAAGEVSCCVRGPSVGGGGAKMLPAVGQSGLRLTRTFAPPVPFPPRAGAHNCSLSKCQSVA